MSWSRSAALVAILLLAGCTAPPPTPTGSSAEATRPPVSSSPSAIPAPSATAPTSATTPAATRTAAPLDTTGWTTYVSEVYGFAIGHPADWRVLPADRRWTAEWDAETWVGPGQEAFFSAGGNAAVLAWAAPYAGEESLAGVRRWVDGYCGLTATACSGEGVPTAVPLCNGRGFCHPGLLLEQEFHQAFFTGGVHGQRMIMVASAGPRDGSIAGFGTPLQVLEAFLSTMDVCRAGEQNPLGCASDTPLAGAATGDPLTTERR